MKSHGHWRGRKPSPTWVTWRRMLDRCTKPSNNRYKYYGGRGIKVCERWQSFENFLADMGERPAGLTLDRRNSDDGYHKENCRWATDTEQRNNRRDSRLPTVQTILERLDAGERGVDLAEEFGVTKSAIYYHKYKRGV